MISESVQNYLKTIYQLETDGETVTTTALADALGISAASATNMIKKLATLKLARHSPYRGVELTKAGQKIALEVIRHHRLVETFLADALGVPWDRVHAEAEKIEHVISEDLEERIADFLGDPTLDPHGDPIPSKSGTVSEPERASLVDIAAGQSAVIQRIGNQDPDHLRHFSNIGLVPNASVNVVRREPFEGPLHVRVSMGREHVIDSDLAKDIWVVTSERQGTKKQRYTPEANRKSKRH
jgi:DtxR family Mn-dependent transcriptional regulator